MNAHENLIKIRYHGSPNKPVDIYQTLIHLILRMKKYDEIRLRLEQQGGTFYDLNQITRVLQEEVSIPGGSQYHKVALGNRESIIKLFNDLGGEHHLHLEVRELDYKMPVYYLCRLRRDFWSEYSLVVEDHYLSPGYPLTDERLVRLRQAGHEVYYLRLSQFRPGIIDHLVFQSRLGIDQVLYDLGRHVFQSAWHEDQRLGMAVARHFNLPCFAQAIELLYLCLSGDLCQLRSVINKTFLHFFKKVYPQPAILALLELLPDLDGRTLTELPQKALIQYSRLSRAFNRFLGQPLPWRHKNHILPLYKLILANFSRLEWVKKVLKGNKILKQAGLELEKEAKEIINELL